MQPDIEPTIEFSNGAVILTFPEHPEPFIASAAAEHYLHQRGFSVGRREGAAPRGILYGTVRIEKWRNLRPLEREALHGRMTAEGRHGPIIVTIRADAPYHVRLAVRSAPLAIQTSRFDKAFGTFSDGLAIAAIGLCLMIAIALLTPGARVLSKRALPWAPKIGLRAESHHLPVETAEARP